MMDNILIDEKNYVFILEIQNKSSAQNLVQEKEILKCTGSEICHILTFKDPIETFKFSEGSSKAGGGMIGEMQNI